MPAHRWRKENGFGQSFRLLCGSAVPDRSDASVDQQATGSGIELCTGGPCPVGRAFSTLGDPRDSVAGGRQSGTGVAPDGCALAPAVESFYEQYEFSLVSGGMPPRSPANWPARAWLKRCGQSSAKHFAISGNLALVDVSAHKLTTAQTIPHPQRLDRGRRDLTGS